MKLLVCILLMGLAQAFVPTARSLLAGSHSRSTTSLAMAAEESGQDGPILNRYSR